MDRVCLICQGEQSEKFEFDDLWLICFVVEAQGVPKRVANRAKNGPRGGKRPEKTRKESRGEKSTPR